MKTTIDIPGEALSEAMRFAKAKTKREAVLACVDEYNRQHRMAELVRHLGEFSDDFPSHEQLEAPDIEEITRRGSR